MGERLPSRECICCRAVHISVHEPSTLCGVGQILCSKTAPILGRLRHSPMRDPRWRDHPRGSLMDITLASSRDMAQLHRLRLDLLGLGACCKDTPGSV
jgi:hypothetical protein